jgi:GNAT superfamily N-acetyltransferase
MISKLENSDEKVANQIFIIFQSSYKVEAQLIGALNFPPLSRSVKDIVDSQTSFYGFYEKGCLVAIIEITVDGECLGIDSLTVEPQYFRKGLAGKLIRYVLSSFEYTKAIVETAVANKPAIKLYNRYGFVEFKRWTPSHGIEKVAMSVEKCFLIG